MWMCAGGRDVDVLSEAAGKGRGLSFLLQRLKETGFEPTNVQVCCRLACPLPT